MTYRNLHIGRWDVDFIFAPDRYEVGEIAALLYDAGASDMVLDQAEDLMWMCNYNCGFTFTNAEAYRAVVVIGPTTSGAEFIDTLVHEVHHLAVAIADNLGVPLTGEGPAYLSGDAARELAKVVCELGCSRCN